MRKIRAKWIRCMRSNIRLCEKKSPVSRSQFHSLRKRKVGKFNRISHVQPSVFRRHNFSRRILPSWNSGLKGWALDQRETYSCLWRKGITKNTKKYWKNPGKIPRDFQKSRTLFLSDAPSTFHRDSSSPMISYPSYPTSCLFVHTMQVVQMNHRDRQQHKSRHYTY
jgi:hypothetical protein